MPSSPDRILNGPDPEGVRMAKEELKITDESLRTSIAALKKFMQQNKKLPNKIEGVNEDKWFENYLILNKNELDRAKENLEIYFQLKDLLPEVYEVRDAHSPLLDKSFRSTCVAWCPKIDKEGRRIAIYGHISNNASDFHVPSLGIRLVAMVDMFLKEGVDWTSLIIICDLSKTKLGHLTKYPIFLMKKFFDYAWKAYPERIAQIHIIHPPMYLEPVLALFRPFLKEKIRKRIMVHGKLESLYEYIDKSLLPCDYGGDLPYTSLEINKAVQEKMKHHHEWLEISKNHRVVDDDAKKIKELKQKELDKNHNDFKNLTVD